jgi:pantoate--beta-alanine ligase
MSSPAIATTRAELSAARAAMPGRVAVVMTMGALHDGHIRLIEVARRHADSVLVTIFVNPLQFAVGEDLARYPRTLAADLETCAAYGVDVVFAPDVDGVYPTGEALVRQHAGALGDRLEGAARPAHFDGVLTVVARLLELTTPDVAVFGEKDAQQLALIRRMVASHPYPVEIVAVDIVREPDGLALSSRNRYLDPAQHATALTLSRALRAGADVASAGASVAVAAARAVLAQAPDIDVDYVAVVDEESWDDADDNTGAARILVAGRVGSTRLIDNVRVVLGRPRDPAGARSSSATDH